MNFKSQEHIWVLKNFPPFHPKDPCIQKSNISHKAAVLCAPQLFGYIAIREVVCWQWPFAPHHTVHTLLLCVNNIKNNKYCNWRDHIRRYMAILECENVVMQVNALIVHERNIHEAFI